MPHVITSAAALLLAVVVVAACYLEIDPDDPARTPTRWKVVATLGVVLAFLLAALAVEVPKALTAVL